MFVLHEQQKTERASDCLVVGVPDDVGGEDACAHGLVVTVAVEGPRLCTTAPLCAHLTPRALTHLTNLHSDPLLLSSPPRD